MAEDKKKKPRKQRKDKGKKRKPRIKNPRLQTGSIEFKHIGTQQYSNPTLLAGLIASQVPRQIVPYQPDYASLVQQEFQKYFNKPSTEIVPKPDVAQAQEENAEEPISEETAALRLQRAAMSSKIQRLRTEAEQAKLDITQLGEINAEMLQQIEEKKAIADELTRSIYQKEYYAQQYQKKARYEEIMRTTGSSKDIKKYYGLDLQPHELHDFRIQLLEEEDIPYELPEKGLRGAPRKPIFAGELPEGTGSSYVTDLQGQVSQLEMERGQMEDQLGGLHDTIRELKMMNEDAYAGHLVSDAIFGAINDLTTEGYERKIQEEYEARQADIAWYEGEMEKRSRAEAETLGMVQQSVAEQLAQKEAQYQQLLGQAQEEYQGLASQMEREGLSAQEQRMALEEEIRTLKESRDAEIAQGLALKNAETARLEENIRTLQRGNEDLQAQMRRLQDDIDFKKQQMEGVVTKKEADELRKEIGRLGKELKFAREQSSKGDAMIIKQQKEKMALEQALTVARTPQKGQEEESSAIASVRQAMGARIEHLRTREERQAEQMAQLEEQFDEERQALKARIIEAEAQRDLIAQTALQQEQEYNEEARVSNLEFEKIQRDLAREGLMSMFFENELKRSGQEALKQDIKRQLEVQTAQADLAVSEYAKSKQKMTIEIQRKSMSNLEKKLEKALERKDFYKELATPPISPPFSRQVSEDTLVSDILYEPHGVMTFPSSASTTPLEPHVPTPKKQITPKVAKREKIETISESVQEEPIREKKARPPLPPRRIQTINEEEEIASGGGGGAIRREDMSLEQMKEKYRYYESINNQEKMKEYAMLIFGKEAQIRQEEEKAKQTRRELRKQQQEEELRTQGFQRRMAAEQPKLARSMSEETSISQQEENKRRTENLAAELGARLPPEPVMSSRAIGLASVAGRNTFQRKGEKAEITPEIVGEKTTALLKEKIKTQKSGGQRQPLVLQPRSMDIDEELARMPVADLQRGQEEVNVGAESLSLDFTSKEARLTFNPQYDAYKLMPAGPEKEAEKARLKALRKSLKESAKVSL